MATYVAVFALVLAYVALVAAYLALRAASRARDAAARAVRGPREPAGSRTPVPRHSAGGVPGDTAATIVANPGGRTAQPPVAADPGALSRVALVRYDAFDGMSGRMSFSLALLDGAGDGVTVSALAGHADTRVYAKGVLAGRAPEGEVLTPEELQAVRAALASRTKG